MHLAQNSLMLVSLLVIASPVLAQEKKPLVTRDRVQLNLAGAETVLEAAKKEGRNAGFEV